MHGRRRSGRVLRRSPGRAALDERSVDAGLEREPGEAAQLGVGLEEEHVEPGDHLRDVLVRDVRQVRSAQLCERHVGPVAEQQELEVVLPHQVVQPQHVAIRVEHRAVARLRVAEGDLVRLVLAELRNRQCVELFDEPLHVRSPLPVELVPVCVVVARALLEVLRAYGDLRRVGNRVPRDVDVAVDAAPVDAGRRWDGEDAVLPRPERLVGGVDADRVERRHRRREVHRVPEPEPLLVRRAPFLVEERVVRVRSCQPSQPAGVSTSYGLGNEPITGTAITTSSASGGAATTRRKDPKALPCVALVGRARSKRRATGPS